MPSPDILFNGPAKSPLTVAFAHGAGAGMESDFMDYFARSLGEAGLRVARFEFPYMEKRRLDGRKRPPDRAPILLETWRAVVNEIGRERCVLAGKSMGGRMASLVVAELEAANTPARGAVYLGYPFHAPGKPMGSRDLPLGTATTPTLILQGERDTFGTRAELTVFPFGPGVSVQFLADGDHSFVPRKASGRTRESNWNEAAAAIADFTARL